MRYYLTPVRMAKLKKKKHETTSVGENVEKKKHSEKLKDKLENGRRYLQITFVIKLVSKIYTEVTELTTPQNE